MGLGARRMELGLDEIELKYSRGSRMMCSMRDIVEGDSHSISVVGIGSTEFGLKETSSEVQ